MVSAISVSAAKAIGWLVLSAAALLVAWFVDRNNDGPTVV